MNEQEVKKILETYAKDCGAEGYLDGIHLDEAIASLKSLESRIEKKDGQYQCKHVKQNIIDCYCPWCNLTVAENAVETLRKKLKSLEPKVEEIEGIIIDEYNEWLSTTDNIGVAFKKAATVIVNYLIRNAMASLKSLEPKVEDIEKVISEYIYIINVDRDLTLDYNSVDEFKKECAAAIVKYLKGEKK